MNDILLTPEDCTFSLKFFLLINFNSSFLSLLIYREGIFVSELEANCDFFSRFVWYDLRDNTGKR